MTHSALRRIDILPSDVQGNALEVGDTVRILSVRSWLLSIPSREEARRFGSLVGQYREIVNIEDGCVWLRRLPRDITTHFCVLPSELLLAAKASG